MKRTELQNNLAMTVTLVTGSMLFLTLFMGYAVYRSSAEAWPPVGVTPVSLWLPLLSTLFIAISSWFCYQTRSHAAAGRWAEARTELKRTWWCGVGFMASQGALWFSLRHNGLYVSSGIFASVMYGFTWIHAFHVVAGLLSLTYLIWVLRKPQPKALQVTINVEKFWHFLGVIWLIMFLGMFVL